MQKVLDISHYQTITDWKKVAKNVSYVICKATQGTSYIDPTFAANKQACRDNGINFGSYHFSNGTDAVKEAKFYLKTVGKIQENDILVLDYEIHLADPVTWCKTFLDYCRDNAGVRPLLYINTATKKAFDWSHAKNYGIWEANYGINDGTSHSIAMPYVLHQYTSNGTCPGVTGRVDLSDTYMSTDDFKQYGYQPSQILTPEVPVTPIEVVTPPTIETPITPQNIASSDALVLQSNDEEPVIQPIQPEITPTKDLISIFVDLFKKLISLIKK